MRNFAALAVLAVAACSKSPLPAPPPPAQSPDPPPPALSSAVVAAARAPSAQASSRATDRFPTRRVVFPYHFRGQDPDEIERTLSGKGSEVRMRKWY